MTKGKTRISLVVFLMLAGVLVAAGAAAPALKSTLDAPLLIAPEKGTTFTSPGYLVFWWTAVENNRGAILEIEKATLIDKNTVTWSPVFSHQGGTNFVGMSIDSSILQGNGYYRWHVRALAEYPLADSKWTKWWTFTIEGL